MGRRFAVGRSRPGVRSASYRRRALGHRYVVLSCATEAVLVPGATLLATKFLPPRPRPNQVRRDRLHRRLARAGSTPITLVSAPAGFGKTALLADG